MARCTGAVIVEGIHSRRRQPAFTLDNRASRATAPWRSRHWKMFRRSRLGRSSCRPCTNYDVLGTACPDRLPIPAHWSTL